VTVQAADIIVVLTIAGCFVLIAAGRNGSIMSILLVIVGYYFGSRSKGFRDN